MSDATEDCSSAVLKLARKKLKKAEDSSMNIAKLVELLLKKAPQNTKSKQIQDWIRKSKKFEVYGDTVHLKGKKRRLKDDDKEEDANADDDVSTPPPKTKKQKASPVPTDPTERSLKSVTAWRETNKIVVMDNSTSPTKTYEDSQFFPFQTFADCGSSIAPALIQQCVEGNKFEKPSPIQAQAWPILSKGRDVVGIAETGSGKTLGFAMPALTRMMSTKQNRAKLRMLVLAPTRELAMQCDAVIQEFGAVVGLKSLVVYGGVPKHTQAMALKRGVDCLVATPGRLKDLLQDGSCSLRNVNYLVLDEADRMLDMGFEKDVRYIIGECASTTAGRQTAMFSATWPAAIQKIAMDFMKDPIRVYVGFESIADKEGDGTPGVEDSLSANKRVRQHVHVIEDQKRPGKLRQILNQVHKAQKERILLFCLYKKEAERMENMLQREGWNCTSIHGNKHQQARTAALQQFKDGSCPLLIATDVAARGLDIPHVQYVINYTFPLTIEDYVHRIGRTGRAGKTGTSYTFFQPTDKAHAGALQQVLRQAEQDVPEELKKFGSTIKKKEHKLYGNFGPKDGQPLKKATKITFQYSDDEE